MRAVTVGAVHTHTHTHTHTQGNLINKKSIIKYVLFGIDIRDG